MQPASTAAINRHRSTLVPGDRGIPVPAMIRRELARCPALTAEEETAVASAIWLAREEAWSIVLADSLASARAAALLLALESAADTETSTGAEAHPATVAARRALLDAISTGDVGLVARADTDDKVLRQVIHRLPVALAARARGCIVRLDAAVSRLEKHNIALVLHVIRCKFRKVVAGEDGRGTGAEFETGDLLGYGMIGTRTAALRFDVRRGYKFSTYATSWIAHYIRRGMQDARFRIRLPVHLQDKVAAIVRARDALREAGEQQPTPEAIAARANLDPKKVRTVIAALDMNTGPSLHSKAAGHDGEEMAEFGDILPDPTAESEDDLTAAMDDARRAAVLHAALGDLDERSRFVVEMRAGIGDPNGQPVILNDLGAVLGLSRERVRQIENAGLKALRSAVEARMC